MDLHLDRVPFAYHFLSKKLNNHLNEFLLDKMLSVNFESERCGCRALRPYSQNERGERLANSLVGSRTRARS